MSANRSKPYQRIIPAWSSTCAALIAFEATVKGACTKAGCGHTWPLDIHKIADRRGPHFSLWGRRIACPKCRDRAAVLLARHAGEGAPVTNLSVATAEEHPEVRDLQRRCAWCGRDAHGGGGRVR